MTEGIIIALIGAGAAIVAALIGRIGKNKKKPDVKQNVFIGNNNTQIGVQNNSSGGKNNGDT